MPIHTALPWTLRSIARVERAGGVRPPRLTEPSFETWHRIRRRLGWRDFIVLLHKDLAEAFPIPFDLGSWSEDPTLGLTDDEAEQAVRAAAKADEGDATAFLKSAARALGLPSSGALSEIPRTQPHQKVLELPGSCGRIAAWQVLNQGGGLAFHDQFLFVADSDLERALIGLAAVEARANRPTVLTSAEAVSYVSRGQRLDRVVGVPGWSPAETLAAQLKVEVRWA